jgi:NAD(P)-dependent dehydrogenase (short-subunit alcohol dehydrogenase family)
LRKLSPAPRNHLEGADHETAGTKSIGDRWVAGHGEELWKGAGGCRCESRFACTSIRSLDSGCFGDAIDRAGELLGGIDILVNDAALMFVDRVADIRLEDIEAQIAVNFAAPILTCRAAIPWLRKSTSPDIVNVSSESVKVPIPYLSVYGATKAALEYFTNALRAELRPDLIRVSILRSGFVASTEINRNIEWSKFSGFVEAVQASGQGYRTGSTGAPPEAMAEGLVSLLALPREVNVDIFEMRPTAP